jgi:hypothetical protein
MKPPLTEQALRRHFEPLAELEPTAADVAALRARCISPPRRRARRLVPACAAGAIALAAALALIPGRTQDTRLAPDVLSVTAATAAARPVPPVAAAPFRYTRIRRTLTYVARRDGREGREHLETTVETWVGSRWRGRERGSAGRRRLSGDLRVARMQLGRLGKAAALTRPYVRPFAYGDGPLARLDPTTLPDDRDELGRALEAGIRTDRWGPYPESRSRSIGMPEDLLRSYTAYQTITLLVYAPTQRPAARGARGRAVVRGTGT